MSTSILSSLTFFAGLDEKTLDGIGSGAESITLDDGDVLFREGDSRDHMYVVVSGQLQIVKGLVSAETAVVATLGPGAILGEGSIFETGT